MEMGFLMVSLVLKSDIGIPRNSGWHASTTHNSLNSILELTHSKSQFGYIPTGSNPPGYIDSKGISRDRENLRDVDTVTCAHHELSIL